MTKGWRGGWAALLGALALACILAGCARHDRAQRVTLHFWAMGREGEVVRQLLAGFEQTHPGIHVEVQQMPWVDAQQKLLTGFAGDVLPDLCQLGNTWITQFAALGSLAPLDARAAGSRAVPVADYFPGIWDSNRVGSALYGVPWYVDTRVLFYRKDLLAQAGFAKPPESWAEWTRALAALKRRQPDDYGVVLPLNDYGPLVALSLQQETPVLRDGGRYGNFRSPGFRRTLQFYADMFHNGWAPVVRTTQIANVWDEFAKGHYAFYMSGPWDIGEFKRRLPAALQDSWGTMPLPGPDGPGASSAGGSSVVIFKNSQHKTEAWQVIEYLSRPDVQRRFFELTGNLPARRSVWHDAGLAQDRYAAAFLDQLERARATPKVAEWEQIATEMRTVEEALVAGTMTLDQAVTELDARTDRILEKRRWMLQHGGTL